MSEIGDEIQTPRTGGGKAKLRRGSNQKMKSDQAGEPSQARADMEQSLVVLDIQSKLLSSECTLKGTATFELSLRLWT